MSRIFSGSFALLFGFYFLFACTDNQRDIRDFYFPATDLLKGRVYIYTATEGDRTEQLYWYYRAFQRDSGLFLVGTQYDSSFQITQMVREKIVRNGSLARSSLLYETDTLTGKARAVEAVIESPNLFPFQVTDSLGIFLFSLKYHPLYDTAATIYIVRNRRYLGDGPEVDVEGKKYPTIRFGIREAIGHEQEGAAEIEGTGEEWYAKGLGLVFYRKSFAGGKFRYGFRLSETISMEEMIHRAGARLTTPSE